MLVERRIDAADHKRFRGGEALLIRGREILLTIGGAAVGQAEFGVQGFSREIGNGPSPRGLATCVLVER